MNVHNSMMAEKNRLNGLNLVTRMTDLNVFSLGYSRYRKLAKIQVFFGVTHLLVRGRAREATSRKVPHGQPV